MRVLVTGANGHVGCNLVRELLRRNHTVVALVRPNADVRGLRGLAIETVHGDVLDAATVESAATGCDAIINLAATYQTGKDPAVIVQPAIEIIRNVLQAAAKKGLGRVVHTSSIVAIGAGDRPDSLLNETHWNERPFDAYYEAKTRSERVAWALAKQLSVPLVAVNPSGILGAWDYKSTPTTFYVEELARGRGQTSVGAFNEVDVRDVAFIHAEALERGTPGERYICAGENTTIREIGEHVAALTGRPVQHFGLPRGAVLAYAWVMTGIARLRGTESSINYSSASETVGRYARFDGTKTQTAFGWKPRTLDDMLAQAIAWGIFLGRIPGDGIADRFPPDPSWVK